MFNVLVFILSGFCFLAFFSKKRIALTGTAMLSLLFEIVQWVFSIGASDITDLITNTSGGLCGMLLFLIMGKIAGQHRMKINNAIGIVIESAGLLLIALLTLANCS